MNKRSDTGNMSFFCREALKVLMIRRIRKTTGDANLPSEVWVFPGADVREGESFRETARRAAREMTGLEAHNVMQFIHGHELDHSDIFYMSEVDEMQSPQMPEAIRETEEWVQEALWVDSRKVKELNLQPAYMKHEIEKHMTGKPERREWVELTNMCMVEDGSRLLLENRVKDSWKGYAFPGGHVDPGESIVQSVIREIYEETGITIRNPRLVGVKQFPIFGGRYIVFLFKTNEFSGEIQSSDEGHVEWIERARLPEIAKVDDFDVLMEIYERDDISEFQYTIEENDEWKVNLY